MYSLIEMLFCFSKNFFMKKITLPLVALLILAACDNKPSQEKTENTKPDSTQNATAITNPNVTEWMSWEAGVDVAAVTDTSFKTPNVIVHVARMVNTPVGNAASGMILYQPDAKQQPVAMGFVSTNKTVGAYFGPKIFAGTPFEKAPVLDATITIKQDNKTATAKVVTGGHVFEVEMTDLGKPYLIDRKPSAMPPFYQQGVEMNAGTVKLKVDGKEVKLILPPKGISGGPAAVVSPNGVYAR